MIMKTEESFYIKILLWAFNKKDGFTEKELLDNFKINSYSKEFHMYSALFKGGDVISGKPSIIIHYANIENIKYWCLSDTGIAYVIDYCELKEARESAREARIWAIVAVLISISVGAVQILNPQSVKVTNFPEKQNIELKSENLKTEVTNFPKIQPVWINNPTK